MTAHAQCGSPSAAALKASMAAQMWAKKRADATRVAEAKRLVRAHLPAVSVQPTSSISKRFARLPCMRAGESGRLRVRLRSWPLRLRERLPTMEHPSRTLWWRGGDRAQRLQASSRRRWRARRQPRRRPRRRPCTCRGPTFRRGAPCPCSRSRPSSRRRPRRRLPRRCGREVHRPHGIRSSASAGRSRRRASCCCLPTRPGQPRRLTERCRLPPHRRRDYPLCRPTPRPSPLSPRPPRPPRPPLLPSLSTFSTQLSKPATRRRRTRPPRQPVSLHPPLWRLWLRRRGQAT